MNTAIVLLLLLGFSICMVAGLITVLQSIINQNSFSDLSGGSMLSERGAEQKARSF